MPKITKKTKASKSAGLKRRFDLTNKKVQFFVVIGIVAILGGGYFTFKSFAAPSTLFGPSELKNIDGRYPVKQVTELQYGNKKNTIVAEVSVASFMQLTDDAKVKLNNFLELYPGKKVKICVNGRTTEKSTPVGIRIRVTGDTSTLNLRADKSLVTTGYQYACVSRAIPSNIATSETKFLPSFILYPVDITPSTNHMRVGSISAEIY